jgi:hypothetical protein
MNRQHHTPQEIIAKLREAKVELKSGHDAAAAQKRVARYYRRIRL